MASVTKSPQTMATSGIGFDWTNPDNAKTANGSYAFFSGANATTKYLKATNFGFAIPSGATINGILVEVKKFDSSGYVGVNDVEAKIIKADGSLGETDKKLGGDWGFVNTYYSYGADDDLWDETWTAEDINDLDFGFAFKVSTISGPDNGEASVDHICITVYYTESVSISSPYPIYRNI